MKRTKRGRIAVSTTDDLDILSAIWILSCNDENPIITYKGISSRLDLPDTVDVRALVRSRRELFRPGILGSRLRAWKDKLKGGRSLPAWIAEIRDQTDRDRAIDGISEADVFRNQFRTADSAPKCGLEIVDWGLNHIERLRKGRSEEQDTKSRKWATIFIPMFSLLIAGFSVSVAAWSSYEQSVLKIYEVSFRPKQEAYSNFMIAITDAAASASVQDKEGLLKQLFIAQRAYYLFEPFLNYAMRADILRRYAGFSNLCLQRARAKYDADGPEQQSFLKEVSDQQTYFGLELYKKLFGTSAD